MDLLSVSEFQFDTEEALKTGFYTSGTPGCGKSDVAMYCIDALRKAEAIPLSNSNRVISGEDIHCIIFDPSQDWMERYPASHVTTFNIGSVRSYIEGIHLNGVEIIDCSNLTILQIQELAELFCRLLYKAQSEIPKDKRKFYFIVFEEAQTEFPQGSMRAKKFQNVYRILAQGRNYNIRVGMITQFAATLDKDAMKYARQRYFGWTSELNDVKYVSHFIGEEEAKALKHFKSGEFIYSFPSENILQKIHIDPYQHNV